MSIEFKNKPLEWGVEGVEPSDEKKAQGFADGEAPAAGHWDHKFRRDFLVQKELQEKISELSEQGIDTSKLVTEEDFTAHKAEDATNSKKGHVQLVDDVNGNSTSLVPTQNAVRKKIEQTDYKVTKSSKDSEGIFRTVEYRRINDNTLAVRSVLSGGTSPTYTTRTITYYGSNGTTEEKKVIKTLQYDADGDLISEV